MKKLVRILMVMVFIVGLSMNTVSAQEITFSKNVYKVGMTHNEVQFLQQALKKDGVFTYSKTTTYFGAITQAAVKDFQKKYGMKVDGIVGKQTIGKMKSLGLISEKVETVSRGSTKRKVGEYLDWWSNVSDGLINRGDDLLVEDFETGKTFNVRMTVGTNHADVEALTKEDTETMKEIWGGFSWSRRPVLVYKDNKIVAASMSLMPHAGVEGKPAGQTVSNRSGGFGKGYNYDFIKENGMSGHVDLHFRNSTRHMDDKKDPQHQTAIKKAAGLN